jgi:hypothetical protein
MVPTMGNGSKGTNAVERCALVRPTWVYALKP